MTGMAGRFRHPPARMPAHPTAWRAELRTIVLLAAPLAAAQLAQMSMATTDAIMMGRIDAGALAAGGLGSNLAMLMILIAQGLLQSIQPIVAHARGAGDRGAAGRTLGGGLLLGALMALPIILVLVKVDRALIALGEPPEIARRALIYEQAFAWGVPASLWQGALRNYLAAVERTGAILLVSAGACLINLLLNWVLIFGHLGLPALGLAGSGYATAIVWWLMLGSLAAVTHLGRALPENLGRLDLRELGHGLAAICRLGWPIAGAFAVEIGLFSGSGLLVGHFGAVALAAHQICLNLSAMTFMVPSAVGNAAAVRVGFHVGAGALARARAAGLAALGCGIGFMTLSAASIRLLAVPIFGLYLDRSDPSLPAVTALGASMIAVAALFQVFDGAQVVASGALRGLKDTRAAFAACVAGYWGLGAPLGAWLALGTGLGPVGLWWGFVAALGVVSLMLCLRFWQRMQTMLAAALP